MLSSLKERIAGSVLAFAVVMKLLAAAPLEPARAIEQLGTSRSLALLATLLAAQLLTVIGVVVRGPDVTASAHIRAYVNQGLDLEAARERAREGLQAAGSRAIHDVTRNFVVDLAGLWIFWSCIGFIAGVRRDNARHVLGALAIGECITTLAFVVRYGTLAATGLQSGEITLASILAAMGTEAPRWSQRLGPSIFGGPGPSASPWPKAGGRRDFYSSD